MALKMFLFLGIIILFMLGCEQNSDGGSTEFFDSQTDGNPVPGIPAPTPFVPSPSPASISVTPADLSISPGTVHTFTVNLSGVTGNGDIASSNILSASSGTVLGLPFSIGFSSVVRTSATTFTSLGFFSGVVDGNGTMNVTLIYTEEDRTISTFVVFDVNGVIPPEICTNSIDDDGDGLIDLADPDCVPAPENCTDSIDNDFDGLTDCLDPDCAGLDPACPCTAPLSVDLTNGVSPSVSPIALFITCADDLLQSAVAEIDLSGAFDTSCPMAITDFSYFCDTDLSSSVEGPYTGVVTFIVLTGDGTGAIPGAEIARTTIPGSVALLLSGTVVFTLPTPISIPSGTTAVYVGVETLSPSTTTDSYAVGFDDTLGTIDGTAGVSELDSYVSGGCLFGSSVFSLIDTTPFSTPLEGNYNFTLTVLGSP
ncbi:MAG: hypothetical protein AABZ60_11935 [Planctomycetota bacterium]